MPSFNISFILKAKKINILFIYDSISIALYAKIIALTVPGIFKNTESKYS